MSLALAAAATVGKKAFEKLFDDIYQLAKDDLKSRIKQWQCKSKISDLYKKAIQVTKVKTIWQAEKAVDLRTFYCPSKIKIEKEEKEINNIADFDVSTNIVIRGTIGQGKSIFLRYLTSQELLIGNAIPVFIELRRISRGSTLQSYVLEEIKNLGLDVDEELILYLYQAGKIILMLDGFDEIEEGQDQNVIDEVESISRRYENTKILITTRPSSGIVNSPYFRVFDLMSLKRDEYKNIIYKVASSSKQAEEIITSIEQTTCRIRNLLTTPLMVALLMLRYRIEQTIPENTNSFYDDLFVLLLCRHDKMKAGYRRQRKSKMSDLDLKRLFYYICYFTRKDQKGVYTLTNLQEYASNASCYVGKSIEADKAVEDIITITCLIVEDGGECKFVHKSVQEYHAACFIKDQPEKLSAQFYAAVSKLWHKWRQEIDFLLMIDKYRYMKYFYLCEHERLIKQYNLDYQKIRGGEIETAKKLCEYLIDGIQIAFENESFSDIVSLSYSYSKEGQVGTWSCCEIKRLFVKSLIVNDKQDFQPVASHIGSLKYTKKNNNEIEVELSDIYAMPIMNNKILSFFIKPLNRWIKEYEESKEYVESQEKSEVFKFDSM